MPCRRRLLLGTRGGWTAVLDNSRRGDPTPQLVALARQAGVRGVVAVHAPPGQTAQAETRFHLYGPGGRPPLSAIRTVDAEVTEDGRWAFRESGDPQPFERLDRYGRRRIRDRLDRPLLVAYLEALGLRPDDPGWYGEGVLVVTPGGWRPGWSASLEEAREQAAGPGGRAGRG